MLPNGLVKETLQAGGQPYAVGSENTPVWTIQYIERNSCLPGKNNVWGGQRILHLFFCAKTFLVYSFSSISEQKKYSILQKMSALTAMISIGLSFLSENFSHCKAIKKRSLLWLGLLNCSIRCNR
jgi:hypothetical protein